MGKPVVAVSGSQGHEHLWRDAAWLREFTTLGPVAGQQLARVVAENRPQAVVLTCASIADHATLNLLAEIRRLQPQCPVILLVSESSEALAIESLRRGAGDYLRAPVTVEAVMNAVRPLVRPPTETPPSLARLAGTSASAEETRARIARFAPASCNVLITGETGTGKELTAELIHRHSTRAARPFVCINCAAIPEALLESELFGHEKGAFTGAHSAREGKLACANGGTVFLDEIGDMNLLAQAKILRAIETRYVQRLGGNRDLPVDVRIIAASNRDLLQLMAEARFRPDLYFRLNVARIHLAPLRERREDIPLLVERFLEEQRAKSPHPIEGLGPELMDLLMRYDWPGNIREMRNFLETVALFADGGWISVAEVPSEYRELLCRAPAAAASERDRLLYALTSSEWNKSAAARKLSWSRMTLYRKMAQYRIGDRPVTRCNSASGVV